MTRLVCRSRYAVQHSCRRWAGKRWGEGGVTLVHVTYVYVLRMCSPLDWVCKMVVPFTHNGNDNTPLYAQENAEDSAMFS